MSPRATGRGAVIGALTLLLAAPAGRAEPGAEAVLAAQPPDLVRTLLESKVVLAGHADASTQTAQGFVIFEQPVERVYRLLSQTTRQREYRPELETIETVRPLEDGSIDEHHLKIMFIGIRYRLRNHWDPAHRRISWELDPEFENDLRRVDGSWELFALDASRTLGVLTTKVEVAAGMPSFLQDYVTRKNLPGTLERCRHWVDADGHLDE